MSEASQNDGKVAKPICDNGKIPNFSTHTHTHYGTFMARAPLSLWRTHDLSDLV